MKNETLLVEDVVAALKNERRKYWRGGWAGIVCALLSFIPLSAINIEPLFLLPLIGFIIAGYCFRTWWRRYWRKDIEALAIIEAAEDANK